VNIRAASWLAWSLLAISITLAVAAVVLGLSGNAELVIVLSGAVPGLVFGATGALEGVMNSL
jgi:hypothetical protein